jgi:hypothetical protein
MALVSLSKLRLHLGLSPDTATDGNDLLTSLEEQATGFMAAISGWDLDTAAAVTDYYNGTGTNVLTLRGVPDTDESFAVYERTLDTWDEVSTSDYTVIVEGGGARAKVLRLDQGWPQGSLNLKVTCTRGYTTATCPMLLQRAILDLVQLWYRTRKTARPTSLAEGESATDADALGLAKVYFNFAVDALHEYPPYAVAEIENLATTIGCSFFRRGADYVLDLAREDLCVVVSGPCYMNEEACNSSEETWTCSYLGVAGTGKTLLEAHQRMTDKIGEFETDL